MLALTLCATLGVLNSAAQDRDQQDKRTQDQGGHQPNDNHNDQAKRPAYQQGARHAQEDMANNHVRNYRGQYGNDQDRAAYRSGYDQAYNDNVRSDRNGNGQNASGHRPYNSRNGNRNRGGNPAQQVGYQDGVNDGRSDRQAGHSFRPTQQQAYKNADHNYSPSYGDRQQYKNSYRQAYQQGYPQGYNSSSRR